MRKEDVISAGVMTIVSVLVLIGFTVAWYTGIFNIASITGMHLMAAEMNQIKIALEEGGEDISSMQGDERYADISLQDMSNIENDKLAPGQFGEVTFYITPSDEGIRYCEIVPDIWISQRSGDTGLNGENVVWYSGEEDVEPALQRLYHIAQEHIVFFGEPEMINPIHHITLEWSDEDGYMEKSVTFYWKWYYEYPFTEEEQASLSEEERQSLIDQYDAEDTEIGNGIGQMKFHFSFSAR